MDEFRRERESFYSNGDGLSNFGSTPGGSFQSKTPFQDMSRVGRGLKPLHDNFQPLQRVNGGRIRYRPPDERKEHVNLLASQKGSIADIHCDDTLRRVSVVFHRHILLCERRRMISRRSGKPIAQVKPSTVGNRNSKPIQRQEPSIVNSRHSRFDSLYSGNSFRTLAQSKISGTVDLSSLYQSNSEIDSENEKNDLGASKNTNSVSFVNISSEEKDKIGKPSFDVCNDTSPVNYKEVKNGVKKVGLLAGVVKSKQQNDGVKLTDDIGNVSRNSINQAETNELFIPDLDGSSSTSSSSSERYLDDSSRHIGDREDEELLHKNPTELLCEENFVKTQWRYAFLRVPRLPLWTPYRMEQVTLSYDIPNVEKIYGFLRHLFVEAQLSSECCVICLVYVERLMERAGVELLARNWHPILLCGMLLASKVWQDLSSWNVEFARICPQYSNKNINKMERFVLKLLKWDLYISGSIYAKYYFALRSLSESKNFRRRYNFMMKVKANKKLEERSAQASTNLYSKSM
mmetsp:Transcript_14311/g.18789  ORF Transcript_14311/g.18789 Transcript_14311/m.18789 type:complete len:517 (+) Transcript_14311:191-1741(+)